jgi:hypothetical protein
VNVDFDSPPSGLTTRGALVAIELGDEGLALVGTTDGTALTVPKPSAVSASGYRLTAITTDGDTAQSVALRRGLTGTTLSAGDWLAPPTGISLSRTGGSWTNASGATVHGIDLTQGETKLLGITVFDSTRTSFELPDLITLPSGPIDAALNAIGAPGFDVTDFALDEDKGKIDRVGGQQTTIN